MLQLEKANTQNRQFKSKMPVEWHNTIKILMGKFPCAGIQGKYIGKKSFDSRKGLIFAMEAHLLFCLETYQYIICMKTYDRVYYCTRVYYKIQKHKTFTD